MKKIIALILGGIFAAGLLACGAKADTTVTESSSVMAGTDSDTNRIGQLEEEGYEETISTYNNGKWIGVLKKDDTYVKVTADFPSATEEEYNALDVMADDYDEQVKSIIFSLNNVQTEDISDQVPIQEELNAYAGRTFGDLEKDGYERTGYCGDEETGIYTFSFEGEKYCLDVGMQEGETIDNIDNCSEEDIRALKIGSVSFNSFSYNFLLQ